MEQTGVWRSLAAGESHLGSSPEDPNSFTGGSSLPLKERSPGESSAQARWAAVSGNIRWWATSADNCVIKPWEKFHYFTPANPLPRRGGNEEGETVGRTGPHSLISPSLSSPLSDAPLVCEIHSPYYWFHETRLACSLLLCVSRLISFLGSQSLVTSVL